MTKKKTDWDLIQESHRTYVYSCHFMNYYRVLVTRAGIYSYMVGKRFYSYYPDTHTLTEDRDPFKARIFQNQSPPSSDAGK